MSTDYLVFDVLPCQGLTKIRNDMDFNERVTMVRDCGCEKGCQHKIVSVTQDFLVHISELEVFLEDFNAKP